MLGWVGLSFGLFVWFAQNDPHVIVCDDYSFSSSESQCGITDLLIPGVVHAEARQPPLLSMNTTANGVSYVVATVWNSFSNTGNLCLGTNDWTCEFQEKRPAPGAAPGRLRPEPACPCRHPHLQPQLPLCIDRRSGPMEMWTDLDRTCVKAAWIHFCGGQHLDHITAYSADNVPVLELCRRGYSQRVIACTMRTYGEHV